eukprot:365861-Chlamydomonas_euryale.AAC.35
MTGLFTGGSRHSDLTATLANLPPYVNWLLQGADTRRVSLCLLQQGRGDQATGWALSQRVARYGPYTLQTAHRQVRTPPPPTVSTVWRYCTVPYGRWHGA